ncbi:MAG: GNAT family protein [Patescibacteria group bacterium]|jgi:RimJ/RimL family protein N-acetyltransferase
MIAPILKGNRIILKPIASKHAAVRYRWYTDPKVAEYQDFLDVSLKKLRNSIIKRRRSKDYFGWMISIKHNRLIGEIQLKRINFNDKVGELAINIGETEFWGQGYASEAIKLVSKFFFNRLKLNRIELDVFSKNIGAIKCYQKCGFEKEGVKRKACFKNGKFYDLILMGILREEWQKKNKS